MKTITIFVSFTFLFSSCFTHKNLSKNEPITSDLLSKLKPGKRYEFVLKSGQHQTIYLTGVEGETLAGFYYMKGGKGKIDWSTTFQGVVDNVSKISVRQHNVGLTITASVLGAAAVVGLIFLAIEGVTGGGF